MPASIASSHVARRASASRRAGAACALLLALIAPAARADVIAPRPKPAPSQDPPSPPGKPAPKGRTDSRADPTGALLAAGLITAAAIALRTQRSSGRPQVRVAA